ncbi:tyrosine-type recombinase/integrase [Rhodococcus koreensis]|uniref:tyrosine-type recombinase/integrase n=1 Tax=Rhodococcus koreensis TaxID=99653 RepID=UPI00093426F7|nr:tyrosine-type recombinase/integrase [Rhodococcus koreensis]
MSESRDGNRNLESLRVELVGSLVSTGDPWEPFRLVDACGEPVGAVTAYLAELQAAGRSTATQRSYGMDLLRWFRFLSAVEVAWQEATRAEARDFSRWIQMGTKPVRPHWRSSDKPAAATIPTLNPVTGRSSPGRTYAVATVAHSETVLRGFYAFHVEAGTGPLANPFPLARSGRPNAHHNQMDQFQRQRAGLYRPRQVKRIPRQIPDALFNELFARLSCDRDRALVAFWVSTGVRASELLGVLQGGVDPGGQLITVVRKGSRAMQQVPASPDAFVWLRLYQQQTHGVVPAGPDDPVWWTLRRPYRALNYHAARAMFGRANALLGSNWSLHDLRHTAAYRLARDPQMPITDVQWVLGHSSLTTTQIYVNPTPEDVVEAVLAHHRRRTEPLPEPEQPPLRYRQDSLDVLFGRRTS